MKHKSKLWLSLFLMVALLFSLGTVTAFAAEKQPDISKIELPKPRTPNYFYLEEGTGGAHDNLTMLKWVDNELSVLGGSHSDDSEAFYEKYGLYDFRLTIQYDVSLDGDNNWQYTPEWDTSDSVGGYGHGYGNQSVDQEVMEEAEFFWLTYYDSENPDSFKPYRDAIITKRYTDEVGDTWDTYHFDTENHSLYIRCRYYMEWETYDKATNTIGEKQYKFSEWSDCAIFGKNSTQVMPEKPTTYAAPVISDLKIVLPKENETHSELTYVQQTPDSVWMANAYYIMMDEGDFDGLETQVSINGGEWQEWDTPDSGGDWCLWNGERSAWLDDNDIKEDTNVKLRIRFLGTDGPGEWSNVLEVNGGGTNTPTDDTQGEPQNKPAPTDEDKCSLCGFCPVPIGLCIFIWIAIAVVVIAIIVIIIIVATKKKKCPNCKTKVQKNEKFCPKCGTALKK